MAGRYQFMRYSVLLPLVLAGCAGARSSLDAPTPVFRAEQFFAGHTEGQGRLKIALSEPKAFTVHGEGEVEADGTLVLDQVEEQDGKSPNRREWRIKKVGAGYAGTLTDDTTDGPVKGDVRGNRLHLAYKMKNGMGVQQWIYLQPGGQVALNRMQVSKFGVPVATLEETIRRQGG